MRTRAVIGVIVPLSLALCAACATTPLKVPVLGNASALAGKWQGEFRSNDGLRSGTIQFDLRAGQDSAFGEVMLIANGPTQHFNAPIRDRAPEHRQVEVLAINFVSITGSLVRGTIARYTDPECGCELRTVFDGALRGDTISGTYRTYRLATREAHDGTWQVRRSAVYANSRVNGNHAVREAK